MSVFPSSPQGKRLYLQYKPFAKNSTLVNMTWDIIVVGSGMSGMSAACALSKYGRKVLLLEQHYLPGGYTHMFSRKGAHWDVGVHAIGDMHEKGKMKKIFDWLSSTQTQWDSLGEIYDTFNYPDNFQIDFPNNLNQFKINLGQKFPEEKEKINDYINLCFSCMKQVNLEFATKILSRKWAHIALKTLRIFNNDWWSVSTDEVLAQLGLSEKLKNVLTAQWGYYGDQPAKSSFAMHALILTHFAKGAYYPRRGSKMIATHLLSEIRKNGGEIVCQAKVSGLVIEKNKCQGVKMDDGLVLKGKKVISAIPARTVAQNWIPNLPRFEKWKQGILAIGHSPSYVCLNLIFEGDIISAGASRTNKWFFEKEDRNCKSHIWDVSDPLSLAGTLYVSFPSLKDKEHEAGEKLRHTGECVTFIEYENVKKWSQTGYQKRPEDYEAFKEELKNRLLKQLEKHMPKIMQYCVYAEVSTPLTAKHFVGAIDGSIYGMNATAERFKNLDLRPKTPLKNFYLTGVDILTTGVCGAMNAGLITAASIEPRIIKKII